MKTEDYESLHSSIVFSNVIMCLDYFVGQSFALCNYSTTKLVMLIFSIYLFVEIYKTKELPKPREVKHILANRPRTHTLLIQNCYTTLDKILLWLLFHPLNII